jgi:hypothetical protein
VVAWAKVQLRVGSFGDLWPLFLLVSMLCIVLLSIHVSESQARLALAVAGFSASGLTCFSALTDRGLFPLDMTRSNRSSKRYRA